MENDEEPLSKATYFLVLITLYIRKDLLMNRVSIFRGANIFEKALLLLEYDT